MKYKTQSNNKYVKERIPNDRLEQYVRDIKIELLEEIEKKTQFFIFEHIKEYGVEIVEGNSEAFDDFRVWLSEKKVELNDLD